MPWIVLVGIPTDEAYGALRRELIRSVARIAVAGAVAGAVAWLLSRRLTSPLSRLAEAARSYAAGDLSARAAVTNPLELAALATALSRMADALQSQMGELRDARRREHEAGERALDELRRLHSEFVAVAAHELRTPVAAVKSYAELLRRADVDMPPAVRDQALARLESVADRLTRLIRSLLGASRIQTGQLELRRDPVDVVAIARRVVDDVSPSAPSHQIQVATHGSRTAYALADADRVEDVLVNLVANAAKYAPPTTPIRVHIAAVQFSTPADGAPGDAIEVRVVDRGPGIPEHEQAAVFERFHRGADVAARAGGLGLGLYIARAYVEAMGGDIGVTSQPGHGATFWFRLPRASVPRPAPQLAIA